MNYDVITIPLDAAFVDTPYQLGYRRFVITKLEGPIFIRLGTGMKPIYIDRPMELVACNDLGDIVVTNPTATAGAEVEIFTSNDYALNFEPGSTASGGGGSSGGNLNGKVEIYGFATPIFTAISATQSTINSGPVPAHTERFVADPNNFFTGSVVGGDTLNRNYDNTHRVYSWRMNILAATSGNRRAAIVSNAGRGMPLMAVLTMPQASAQRARFGRWFLETDMRLGTIVSGAGTTRKLLAGLNLAGISSGATVNAITGLFWDSSAGANYRLLSLVGINGDVNQPLTTLFDLDTGIPPSLTRHDSLRLELTATELEAYINDVLVQSFTGPIAAATWNALLSDIIRANVYPMNSAMGPMIIKDASAINADAVEAYFGATHGLRFGWIAP